MHLAVILKVTGILLTVFSSMLAVPVVVALIYGEATVTTFGIGFLITLLAGIALMILGRGRRELRSGDGFLITVLFYLGLGLFGGIPIFLAESIDASFTDAAFESLSALTTTGATVITGLDALPKSLLFYRQLLQWFGGMGIIVLAVAILPMLGIGGMQLYRAESPGPIKDNKLTPRITETAKALWYLYLGITCLFHRCDRRLLNARREPRLFRQPGHRRHRHRVHGRVRHQFRPALHGAESAESGSVLPRS